MDKIEEKYSGKFSALGIGVLFMVIALIVQEIIQSLPTLYFLFVENVGVNNIASVLLNFEKVNIIEYSAFIGIVAGFCQEFSKYVAVDTRRAFLTAYIGLGFSAVDLAVILFPLGLARPHLNNFEILIISFNIILSIIFHPSTAIILKWGRSIKRPMGAFLYALIAHALIDGGLVYTDLRVIEDSSMYHTFTSIYWGFALFLTGLSLIIALKLFGKIDETPAPEKPVIY